MARQDDKMAHFDNGAVLSASFYGVGKVSIGINKDITVFVMTDFFSWQNSPIRQITDVVTGYHAGHATLFC